MESYGCAEIQGTKQVYGYWIYVARVSVFPVMYQGSRKDPSSVSMGGQPVATWLLPKKILRKSLSKKPVPQSTINLEMGAGS